MKNILLAVALSACGSANAAEIVIHSVLFEPIGAAMTRAFNEAHKAQNLTLKIVRGQTGAMVSLYDQELRAGKVSTDVMFLGDPGMFLKLAREGKLTPYCSPNFKDYRPEALSKDCTHMYFTAYYQYIAYNPELVKPSEVPTSWRDLLDPKWKGRVSIPDPKVGGGHYYFVFSMYKLFGREFFEKARANEVMITQSHGTTHNQLMAGERAIGVDISALVRRDGPYPGGKGAPVREAFPKEGGSLLPIGLGITKNGPNPALARLFVDWLTSLEGQKAVNRLGHFSLRKDFTSVEGDDLSKLRYHWWDAEELDRYRDQWTAEALKILN
ncbi:MAG TPA: extracellular solute-binding protein [Burkholderiales bacterium]|nr:extracellular solute-binding protein [Burkholderiales bacterium]